MKLEERLNEIISEKDDRIMELETEVENLKSEADLMKTSWQRITAFKEDEFYKQLPFPRLEMRLNRVSKENWYRIEWIYGLVYKHATDTFGDNDTLLFIPMGRTDSSGGKVSFSDWLDKEGSIQLPFRDGMHIYAESLILNLPAYIVCKEMSKWNKIEDHGWGLDCLSKMKSQGTT